jgi:hypothetical protein
MTKDLAADITYKRDKIRAPFMGILEAGWQAFPLLIAIRYYNAPESIKAFIAGAGPIGFLLTPLTLYIITRIGIAPAKACALMFVCTALLIAGASIGQSLITFTICIIGSQMASVQHGPLMLQVYANNYSVNERGQRVTTPLVLIACSTILFAWLGGEYLDKNIQNFRYVFVIMLFAALVCAWALKPIPCSPLSKEDAGNPWSNLSLIWKDKLFGYLLGSWMLLGMGNLIALPIRVEYLASSEFGIHASNKTIAVLMIMIPAIARLLSTHIWGHFFDKLHFVTTRNLLNIFFLLSVGLFFFSKNIVVLGIAMAFQGIAMGGGKIFWGLWVTKIAPRESASAYMSIHMALTGLRGTLAPFIGYWILAQSSPKIVAIVGMGLIACAFILFECARNNQRLRKIET